MCTIMSVSRDFFNANRADVRTQILKDSWLNSDGCTLLTIGKSGSDTTLLRTMSVDVLLAVLEEQMATEVAERCWIHMRYATTNYVAINGCHGFAAGNYTVMHNGVLTRPEANHYLVDSELIADEIMTIGVDKSIENLATYEKYANCFLIDNTTGKFTVVRMSQGTLFTDGYGNYSTESFGDIKNKVPKTTRTDFDDAIVIPPKPRVLDLVPGHSISEWDVWSGDDETASIIECLRYADDQEDFVDMVAYEGWTKTGIPWAVWAELSVEQLTWAAQMNVWPLASYSDQRA